MYNFIIVVEFILSVLLAVGAFIMLCNAVIVDSPIRWVSSVIMLIIFIGCLFLVKILLHELKIKEN